MCAEGIPCFAPTQEAAEIEGSKTFAKDFMARHGIPTAAYACFDNVHAAQEYVSTVDHRIVIKADGLAAGKGVVLPDARGGTAGVG
jgi:phosphoribosylamine--glycine ligase/phosphoribosylformylglycinamidine cyclo-ligase